MVIVERSDCLISKHWAGLVFMTSDPSGETVNKIHPGLVTGDEQHNNTVSSALRPPSSQSQHWTALRTNLSSVQSAILTCSDTDTDCQRNEICHELLSWEFLTEKKRLSRGGQSRASDKKAFFSLTN